MKFYKDVEPADSLSEPTEWCLKTSSGITFRFSDPETLLNWKKKPRTYKELMVSPDGKNWVDFGEFIEQFEKGKDSRLAFIEAFENTQPEPNNSPKGDRLNLRCTGWNSPLDVEAAEEDAVQKDPAEQSNKDAALRRAACRGHLCTVKILLDLGADPHAYNEAALCVAIAHGHTEVVKLLIEAGSVINKALKNKTNLYNVLVTIPDSCFVYKEGPSEKAPLKEEPLSFPGEVSKTEQIRFLAKACGLEDPWEFAKKQMYQAAEQCSTDYLCTGIHRRLGLTTLGLLHVMQHLLTSTELPAYLTQDEPQGGLANQQFSELVEKWNDVGSPKIKGSKQISYSYGVRFGSFAAWRQPQSRRIFKDPSLLASIFECSCDKSE